MGPAAGPTGARPGVGLVSLAATIVLIVAPPAAAAAQDGARAEARATVTIPPFSHLDVAPLESTLTPGRGDREERVLRLRVRANHPWSVVVARSSAGSGTPASSGVGGADSRDEGAVIECRGDGPHGRTAVVPPAGGEAVVVAVGGKGRTDVVVSCRVPTGGRVDGLIWTLAGA